MSRKLMRFLNIFSLYSAKQKEALNQDSLMCIKLLKLNAEKQSGVVYILTFLDCCGGSQFIC